MIFVLLHKYKLYIFALLVRFETFSNNHIPALEKDNIPKRCLKRIVWIVFLITEPVAHLKAQTIAHGRTKTYIFFLLTIRFEITFKQIHSHIKSLQLRHLVFHYFPINLLDIGWREAFAGRVARLACIQPGSWRPSNRFIQAARLMLSRLIQWQRMSKCLAWCGSFFRR